ncbi:MAG: GNAT family N-acetyltransferase [Gaiellaceae bacterium]
MRELDPEAWDELLAELGCTDSYLLGSYVQASAVAEGGRPAFLEHDGVVLACLVRDVQAGGRDVTTPYGYGGPVAAAAASLDRFWSAYEAWCTENGIVSTFVRFHPRFENQRLAEAGVHVERLGPAIAWPLDGDLVGGLHRTHRNKVRKAERAGVAVTAHEAPDGLAAFVALYEDTMRRAGAGSFYFFGEEYWKHLLTGPVVRFDGHLEGELVVSTLCLGAGPWLYYHLSANSEDGRRSGASNLLLLEAARWAREQGYDAFYLGGGVGVREDSLFAFKEHFHRPGRLDLFLGKAVHDRERYLALAGAAEVDYAGFFPAYRRP